MNQNTKPQFLSLAEDLHVYILNFLPYRDILQCASVCTGLRQTYLSSSVLQYIVELGGQQLLPVNLRVDGHTPISDHLQLLRDQACAWFKFDTRPVQTVAMPKIFYTDKTFVSNGHLCLCDSIKDQTGFAKIFPLVPELSQQAIDREWSSESLSPLPDSQNIDVLMDPEQNLIAAAYGIIDGSGVYIDLFALDGDGVHPQAAGATLIISPELPGRHNMDFDSEDVDSDSLIEKNWRLESLGRHIALWHHEQPLDDPDRVLWWLQIWDWQYSTTSNCVLSDTVFNTEDSEFDCLIDFRFLGNNRLLIVMNDNMKVYSIEDMSQAPQLLACFLLPAKMDLVKFFPLKINSNLVHTKRTMWTSDPAHRLLSLIMHYPLLHFVISTSIFFQLDFFEGMTTEIPWKHWGPSNSRVFEDSDIFGVGVGGNRVLKAIPIVETAYGDLVECRLHMMDFSPLAVKHRQGLGQVVREPSTVDLEGELVTTSLPYVEVVSETKFSLQQAPIRVDKDRIYMLHDATLEVIEVWDGVSIG